MAGSGPFGLLTSALGQRDVRDDIADYQTQQLTRNRAAAGLDPDGNPLPPQPPQPPGGPAQQGAPPPTGGTPAMHVQTQDPSQTPNAHKTPADLGTMLMRLGQQEESEQGFNQALGMGFAAFAQPRDREMVSKMFNVNLQDPNKLGDTLLAANSAQAGQDQTNAIRFAVNDKDKGPLIARKLNMSWEALKTAVAADPGAAGKIATALGMPTDALKNLTQLGEMGGGGGPGGGPATDANGTPLSDAKKGIVAGVAGQEFTAINTAQDHWRSDPKNQGKPDSEMPWKTGDLGSYNQYIANEKAKEDDRGTASQALGSNNELAMKLKSSLEQLRDSPGMHSILTVPGKREVARSALNAPNDEAISAMVKRNLLTQPEADAIAILRQIKGMTTESAMKTMAGTGTRVTNMEVGPLTDAVGRVQNIDQSYTSFIHNAINPSIASSKRTIATNYGNTGNVKNMDKEYAPWLDENFRPGGELFKEGGGAEDIPKYQPVPQNLIDEAKKTIKGKPHLKDDYLDDWQQQGFDTKHLRAISSDRW